MTKAQVIEIFDRVQTWPPERQADVIEVVKLMEAQDKSGLRLTGEQVARAATRRGGQSERHDSCGIQCPPAPPLRYHLEMEIRDAQLEDAPGACQVLRRSITELCTVDHGNDPAILARWLSNKTPENVASWMARPDNSVLVAVEHGTILAVGSVTDRGEVTLNYVSPDARFKGVSRALLRALETRAAERGNARCTLTSTETARRFYQANGYIEDGRQDGKFGTPSSYAMSKLIKAKNS